MRTIRTYCAILAGGSALLITLGANAIVASESRVPPARQSVSGMPLFLFFLGEWDIEALSPDGERIVGRARTVVRLILDERAMQADYYGLDRSGRSVFRGTTIRTYVPATERFAVHWAMAELPGYTYIDEEYRDGELHGDGRGFDGEGEFVERYRYFDMSETSYSFAMSRSYDDGVTWRPYANLRATKRSTEKEN